MESRAVSKHDLMVRLVAKELSRKGYAVRADHIAWPAGASGPVAGHVPDVFAISTVGERIIIEVETFEAKPDSEMVAQWRAFSTPKAQFWVVVPRGAASTARQVALRAGLHPRIREI